MATLSLCGEAGQTWSFRGTKSRNKVTVGEPAVGSLAICYWLSGPRDPSSPNLCALLLSLGFSRRQIIFDLLETEARLN
jgi:hypothetical protein